MSNAIEVQNISKVYKLYETASERFKESVLPFGKRRHQLYYALDNVSFSVKKGEPISIIGRNGSGKSTLLKIISGVLTPSSGRVTVRGKVAALLELGAGFNPELTGLENIYVNGMIMGLSRQQIEQKLDAIVSFADIGEYIHQPVKIYSSGMFARLAFAVGTNVDPDVFIVDEALSVGDIFFQAKSMRKIKELVERGTTLLFVSHDLYAVRSLCKSALWLQAGRVLNFGDASTLTAEYAKTLIEDINGLAVSKPADTDVGANARFRREVWASEGDDFGDDPKHYRVGTGEARIRRVEVLDAVGRPLNHTAEFNEEITLKCYVEVMADCRSLSVDFHIRNKQGQEITGNDTYLAGTDLSTKSWREGERFVVTFRTRLPIMQGVYSINVLIANCPEPPIITDVTFLDWIENAYIFEMQARRPVSIFDFVYLGGEAGYQAL